jgi:hypothetical protein
MSATHKRTQPYAHSRIVKFLDKHLDSIQDEISQGDIADALGYPRANIISMFKTGHTRVPLEKIPDLAKAIRVDPALLMRLGLDQYWPGKLDVLARMFSNIVTDNERKLVDGFRDVVGDRDYRPSEETLDEIKGVIERAIAGERRQVGGVVR